MRTKLKQPTEHTKSMALKDYISIFYLPFNSSAELRIIASFVYYDRFTYFAENYVVLKDVGNPISIQVRACRETSYPKSVKYGSKWYSAKLALTCNSAQESGTRGRGGGKKNRELL